MTTNVTKLQLRRIRDRTLYIRAMRVRHAIKRLSAGERKYAADQIRLWREDCWHAYRIIWQEEKHLLHKSPWAFFSVAPGVKCG